jgi:WD40 repeat protein
MDGLTSIWSIETNSIIKTIQDRQGSIITGQVSSNSLLQSVKNGFSQLSDDEFTFQETGFTLSKFIVCEKLGRIYGIDKASPGIIRCLSSYFYVHLEDLDICNTIEAVERNSFYNLVMHGDDHLILVTRNCSLFVYNLQKNCFQRSILNAHLDLISCLISTNDGKMITGSKSLDGTITVWIDMFD